MDPLTRAKTFEAKDQPKEKVLTKTAAQANEKIGQDLETNKVENVATVADKDVEVKAADKGTVSQGPI